MRSPHATMLLDELTRTSACLSGGWTITQIARAKRAQERNEMPTAPSTATVATPRYVAGAGSHVKRNVPGKRIKTAHRKYGAGTSLKAFARQCARPALPGFPTAPDGVVNAAAVAWLAGKGQWPC